MSKSFGVRGDIIVWITRKHTYFLKERISSYAQVSFDMFSLRVSKYPVTKSTHFVKRAAKNIFDQRLCILLQYFSIPFSKLWRQSFMFLDPLLSIILWQNHILFFYSDLRQYFYSYCVKGFAIKFFNILAEYWSIFPQCHTTHQLRKDFFILNNFATKFLNSYFVKFFGENLLVTYSVKSRGHNFWIQFSVVLQNYFFIGYCVKCVAI